MRLAQRSDKAEAQRTHLTYCTNIHSGESWTQVRNSIENYVLVVKQQVSPDAPFGIGLRISDLAARELENPAIFEEFSGFLAKHDLYVFTINGFPYGNFHSGKIKDMVYLPDWRDIRRLEYTNRLAELLLKLLPDEPSLEGSISTVPGAFKPHLTDIEKSKAAIAEQLLIQISTLHELYLKTGKILVLGLEPEPLCLLETTTETITYFEEWLLSRAAIRRVSALCSLNMSQAEIVIRRHLGVCFDTCHMAVEFEDAIDSVQRLQGAGIRIAKLQLSSALQISDVTSVTARSLRQFSDEIYLHQVVERSGDSLRRMNDLTYALATFSSTQNDYVNQKREWRIHYHVPIWCDVLGQYRSTKHFLEDILDFHRQSPIAPHLEVETYTWSLLPEMYRNEPVTKAIARELQWVLKQLG